MRFIEIVDTPLDSREFDCSPMDAIILDREEFPDFAQGDERVVAVQERDDGRWRVVDFAGTQDDFRSAGDGALVSPDPVDVSDPESVYGFVPSPRERWSPIRPIVNSNRPGAGRERTLRRIG